ncbi:Ger(x)C family spore germination protein [Paenibacillus sp. FSL R5-0766]|uniref:Ger(x)C family spore germination protein n=1 Tax=unclassified Paenibacillus TaxID=185978 RepID=UPI00096D563F|nr:Ger(x)C family spore germination protein [Paenibacillus sp. FSL R5-0765]OMF63978.1 hypothetical protein BK141_15345 [Paenibacillus sp. FSL R5-0765]
MNRIGRILLILMVIFLLSSCKDTSIINKISLVLTSAYDLQDNHIHNSVLIGEYSDKDKSDVRLMEIDSSNNFDVVSRMNMQSKEPIEYGQLRVMVLGEIYARHGIGNILHILSHNTKVSRRMQLAVAEGKALDIIKASMPFQDPLYLMKLIEQNANYANLPHSSLHQTLFQYFSKGQDIYLPRLTLNEQQKIELDGLVIFRGELATLQINEEEGLCLKLLTENAKNGKFLVPVTDVPNLTQSVPKEPHYALLKILSSSVKHRSSDPQSKTLDTSIRISASVIKDSQNDFLLSGNDMKALEYEIQQHMEEKINRLVQKFQSEHVDPVGFGDYVKSRTRQWNSQTFYKNYSAMDIRLHVDLHLIQDGIQE